MSQSSRNRLCSLNNQLMKSCFSTSQQAYPYRIEELHEERSIILHPLKDHKYSIVWLHGLGDSAYGFVDIFLQDSLNFVPRHTKVVLLTAPERAVSLNGGMVMNSWYDISELRGQAKSVEELEKMYDKKEMEESIEIVSKHLNNEIGLLKDSKNVFVGGFSQGCALALATYMNFPQVLGGVIGLSGMNALTPDWSKVKHLDEKKKQPIYLFHGQMDDVIKYNIASLTYEVLKKQGFNIKFDSEQRLGHSVSENEIAKIRNHLKDIMV